MKYRHFVLAVLLAVVSAGCRDKPAAAPDIKVDSASEALRKDQKDIAERFTEQKAAADANSQRESARGERQQNVEALLQVANKLSTAIQAASTTGRSEIAALIKSVEAIRGEANAVVVDDCTGKVRNDLQEAVNTTLDAFNTFAKETGAAGEASRSKIAKATDQVDAISQALNTCRTI